MGLYLQYDFMQIPMRISHSSHSSVKVENSINYKYIAEKQEMDEFLSKLESVLSCVTQTNKSLLNEIFDLEIAKVCS